MNRIKIAVAGNPNAGKTTIFNALTGDRQHVGNYPGVTVEKKEGSFKYQDNEIFLTDLPGTYSLTSRSLEERIARHFLINEKPDIIIDIIDASNLERNLYLATQLMELNIPLILVLNMNDCALAKGQHLDINLFAELTNTLVIETVGSKRIGINDLKNAIIKMHSSPIIPHRPDFGQEIMPAIHDLSTMIKAEKALNTIPTSWLTIKLLENDKELINHLPENDSIKEILNKAFVYSKKISKHFGDDVALILAEKRYGYISGLMHETILETAREKLELSDQIDNLVTHRIFGIPIFLGLMYLAFYITFKIGEYPMSGLEHLFNWLGVTISGFWDIGSTSAIKSLIVDGIIGGVGGVIVFLPNIVLLFLAIAILEDTGYMARAAFIMDRLMHKIGLHGKSFIPMIVGFGCTVPAIMATRIIEDKKDRITTMLILPLMSCGARFPIYTLIIPAFFSDFWRAKILWIIYIFGILLAIFLAKILKSSIFKGESTPFVMELPPYRMPTLRGLGAHIWERSFLYLKKAGTLILAISVIMWVLSSYPKSPHTKNFDEGRIVNSTIREQINHWTIPLLCKEGLGEIERSTLPTPPLQREGKHKFNICKVPPIHSQLEYSIAGRIGKGLAYVLKPLGFDWKISTALLGSFAAKEVFVAQMSILNSIDNDGGSSTFKLRENLAKEYNPLIGFCVMIFCLIATPCLATVMVTRKESGRWKWAALQFFGLTFLAYIITLVIYQVGKLVASY